MKIILNQDVYNLGEEGDVCEVKRGYARNYLIPKALAYPYKKQYIAMFESKRASIEERKEQKRNDALSLKDRLENVELALAMPAGDTGKLFGAVTNQTIGEELNKLGFSIERKKIELSERSIKMIGNYSAKIKLYDGESATIQISISSAGSTKSEQEALAEQNKKDKSVKTEKTDKTAEENAEAENLETTDATVADGSGVDLTASEEAAVEDVAGEETAIEDETAKAETAETETIEETAEETAEETTETETIEETAAVQDTVLSEENTEEAAETEESK